MMEKISNGTRRRIDGRECVFYDGYWVRYYQPPGNTLAAKSRLIGNLTKRLFHHTEAGINTPGEKLEAARRAYQREIDPARKRVNGAMLAGALFNRATDIFQSVVELAEKGVRIKSDNELMKQCSDYFQEALELGKSVKHYSGHEGIDELWGEPFKAFVLPIEEFYDSRYIKIAQTMRDIDRIGERMLQVFEVDALFDGIAPIVREYCEAAKLEAETMRSDPVIFSVWPRFVAAGEALAGFAPALAPDAPGNLVERAEAGVRLAQRGQRLLSYLAGARVPMPKSTSDFFRACDEFERAHSEPAPRHARSAEQ